ncbi:hypothetical protein F66182_7926 [Fusarium sp. NRRL 66182]|nr:hypothetical protein F66182_7926 [Fusarium sp. NRRL 66182]
MQIKAILFAPLVAAGLVSAAPQKSTRFEALALRSASPIHFAGLQAANGGLALRLPKQNANCGKRKGDNTAVFNLVGDELFLYRKSTPHQQIWVDRSGMGQGVTGYTDSKSFPRNAETKGWKVDKYGNLNFKGQSLVACPISKEENGPWSIWVSTGNPNPGFNKGCLGFSARTFDVKNPASCKYTQQ